MSPKRKAVFAIPGDLDTVTGGYIYEKRLLEHLRRSGREVRHLRLPDSFPMPSDRDMEVSAAALSDVDPGTPIILDGFVSGGIDPVALASIRAPTIAMVHHPLAMESGLDAAQRTHLFTTERANLELVDHVLVPSPHTAGLLVGEYGVPAEKITIATPGTDRPLQPQAAIEPPLILAVGLHHPRKGHDVLLKALGLIADLNWQACVVGRIHDAPSFEGLLTLRRDLGLETLVEIQGQVSQEALDRLWTRAQIFALASEFEGYGMVFAEALVRGLPVVACRAGAIQDTVPERAGLFAPPRDPEAFANALRTLLATPSLRAAKAEAARAAGADLPEWDDTARIAGAILDRLSNS
ncbi:MAG: glycosyltransferase family 4 protein [Pseudomonadota bacterium]